MSLNRLKSKIMIWVFASRPKTLLLALVTSTTGSVIAKEHGKFSLLTLFLISIVAVLLQILSNFANDYGDGVKDTDKNRIGPPRSVQLGLITKKDMKKAIIITSAICFLAGVFLLIFTTKTLVSFLSFIVIGIIAIISAIKYTVGKNPYGYSGFGDFFVFIFFGYVAVLGSYFLQMGGILFTALIPATSCGLLTTSVLNINNLRDENTDRESNKKTLIVKNGQLWGKRYHLFLLSLSLILFCIFLILEKKAFSIIFFLVALPLTYKNIKLVFKASNANEFLPLLEKTVKYSFIINLTFIITLAIN